MESSKEDKALMTEVYKEASELNDFETPYVPKIAEPLLWSIEKYKVAEMLAFSGKTKKAIAKELALPMAVINKWCSNSEFMDAVYKMSSDQMEQMKKFRVHVLQKIVMARVEQAELEGYADASRKDTVEIIAELRKESGEDGSKDSTYARLLEKLVLNPPTTQIINVGGVDK